MLSFSWRRFFQAKCVGGEWFLLKMERTAGFAGDETQPKKREARHCDNVSSIFQNCWSCMAIMATGCSPQAASGLWLLA